MSSHGVDRWTVRHTQILVDHWLKNPPLTAWSVQQHRAHLRFACLRLFSTSLFNISLFKPQLALAKLFLPSVPTRCPAVIQCPWRSPLRMSSTTRESCSPFWFPHSLRRSHLADEWAGPSLTARHGISTMLPNHEADFELSDS